MGEDDKGKGRPTRRTKPREAGPPPEAALGGGDERGRSSFRGKESLIDRLLGEPGERKVRLIGLGGVVVVVLLLVLFGIYNHRSTERKNLGSIGAMLDQNHAVARFSVVKQEAGEGVVITELRWAELAPSGEQGNEQEILVEGEMLHLGVSQGTVKHRKIDAPLEIQFFRTLQGTQGESVPLVDNDGPYYFQYQGDRQGSVRRTSKRLWAYLLGEKETPGFLEVTTQQLAGHDIALLLGEEWEVSLGQAGQVDVKRLRSPLEEYERFTVSTPVKTSNDLEIVVEEIERQVEFADQIDPELIYMRMRLRLHNAGGASLTMDPNLFQLQDDRGVVFRPARGSKVTLKPGSGQTLRLRFLVPPSARALRFTIPGETVAGGDDLQPVVIFLDREQAYTGDVQSVGDFLASLDFVERKPTADGFEVVAYMGLANMTDKPRNIEASQFELQNLRYDKQQSIKASAVSTPEIDPFLPDQVTVTFQVGKVLERADMHVRFTDSRRKVVHQEAVFNLVPLPEAEQKARVGQTYLRQICGARQFLMYKDLMPAAKGGVLGILADKKAREREALRHLGLAERYYPESAVIAAER